MDEHRTLGLRLLDEHKIEIADLIVEQSRKTAPAVKAVDPDARRASIAKLLEGLRIGVQTGDDSVVLRLAKDTADLRMMSGVDQRTLLAASHCYLPMIRKVLVARAPDPLAGLHAFEAIEGAALETVVAATVALFPEDVSMDDFIPIGDDEDGMTDPQRPRYVMFPFGDL